MSARIARNRWLAALLALAMLCAQAMALRHATLHHVDAGAAAALSADAGGAHAAKHGLGAADSCLKCLFVEQLASALPAAHFEFGAAPHESGTAAADTARIAFHARVGPPARGPPSLS